MGNQSLSTRAISFEVSRLDGFCLVITTMDFASVLRTYHFFCQIVHKLNCCDDQLLENPMRHEIIEMNQLLHALPNEGNKVPLSEPRKSAAIACGATVFEVTMKVPVWASQVLKHLAPDVSYHSLVALGRDYPLLSVRKMMQYNSPEPMSFIKTPIVDDC